MAHAAFACPPKLRSVLAGNDAIEDLCQSSCSSADFDVALPVGDLPRVLHDSRTPLPVRIKPTGLAEWRERLGALGPPPYLGVTWRAGSRQFQPEFAAPAEDPLYKEIDAERLGPLMRGWRGTVLVLQRLPSEEELKAFDRALGLQRMTCQRSTSGWPIWPRCSH